MPKERVAGLGGYDVHVGWSRDRDVQVGVVSEGERSLAWTLYGQDLDQLGAVVRGLVATADPTANDAAIGVGLLNALDVLGVPYTGVWADLDRQGCNQLIRLVRRGRDQAFGRDE